MIKRFVLALFLLAAAALPANALGTCSLASKEEFMANVQRQVTKFYTLEPGVLEKVMKAWNTSRIDKGVVPLEADELLVAQLSGDRYGIVLFFKGCVVPGTALAGNRENMIKIFEAMGLTPADFEAIVGV